MKKIIVLFFMCLFIITGCGKQEETVIDNNANTLEQVQQFYDESRLDLNKTYTFEDAVSEFSFAHTYYEYPSIEEGDFSAPQKTDVIYSYIGDNDKLKFDHYSVDSIYFNYYLTEQESLYITVEKSENTKDNYKEIIESEKLLTIVSEEDDYLLYKGDYTYSTSYYLVKFYEDGRGLVANYSDDYFKGKDVVYEGLKNVLDSIERDNGTPILQDKIVSISNFNNQKLISYKYVNWVDGNRKYFLLSKEGKSLIVSDSNHRYSHLNSQWEVLSTDPYITVHDEQKVYKVVVNGFPQYYDYSDYSTEDGIAVKADGTLDGLNKILNIFYK